MNSPDRYRDIKFVADRYGISISTVLRRIQDGTIPKPLKIGVLNKWTDSQLAENDARLLAKAEEGAAA